MYREHQTNFFYTSFLSALVYLVFIVAIPVVAVFLQFHYNDKTMFLSFFTAGFALTYDYIALLWQKKIVKRLWVEAILSCVTLLATSVIGFFKVVMVLGLAGQAVTYDWKDLLLSLFLAVPVVINCIEFTAYLVDDYHMRYSADAAPDSAGREALINGGRTI